jgi:hypothetical protein
MIGDSGECMSRAGWGLWLHLGMQWCQKRLPQCPLSRPEYPECAKPRRRNQRARAKGL